MHWHFMLSLMNPVAEAIYLKRWPCTKLKRCDV